MPHLPPVYHKLMALLDEPDLTETQSVLIRMTANLLAQDAVEGTVDEDDLSKTIDPRLLLNDTEQAFGLPVTSLTRCRMDSNSLKIIYLKTIGSTGAFADDDCRCR